MRAIATALLALWTATAAAQGFTPSQRQEIVGILRDALRTDPSILRDAVRALEADEANQQDRVTRDVLALIGPKLIDPADPVEGAADADVTLVTFYDTRCPYCRRMLDVEAALLRADPRVRIVKKDMPILGANSLLESRALLAAQKQGGYFPLQAALMHASGGQTPETLRAAADRLGLDGARLLRDMEDPAIKDRLQANIALAQQIGIQGTPAAVIGQRLVSGAVELAELQKAVADARARP